MKNEKTGITVAAADKIFKHLWPHNCSQDEATARQWFMLGYAWQQQRIDAIEADIVKLVGILETLKSNQ